ncbi:MAG: hypothetical protein H7144_04285 [Burkholderiales bacterium]|nr:hypothetical protein [Phycisphaerae bacterium]
MRTRITGFVLALAILTLPFPTRAATPAEVIKPFLSDSTIAVVHADLTNIDLAELEKQGVEALQANAMIPEQQRPEAIAKLHEAAGVARKWLKAMNDAGGREIYILFDMNQLMMNGPVMIVPFTGGANTRAISGLLHSGDAAGLTGAEPAAAPPGNAMRRPQMLSAEVGNTVVHAGKPWIDRIKTATPVDNPALVKAFESAGDAPITVAIAPGEAVRKQLETAVPALPAEMGGAPITDVSRGIAWASIRAGSGPDKSTTIIIEAISPDAAQKLEDIANTGLDLVLQQQTAMLAMPALKDLIPALRPEAKDQRLTVTLDKRLTSTLIGQGVFGMRMAQQQSTRVQSATHIRQITMAIHLHSASNGGALPATMEDLKTQLGPNFATLMINPDAPNQKPGYIYVKPVEAKINLIKNTGQRLLVYEAFDKWPGQVNVGFADGHVEMIGDQARFDKLLKEAQPPLP